MRSLASRILLRAKTRILEGQCHGGRRQPLSSGKAASQSLKASRPPTHCAYSPLSLHSNQRTKWKESQGKAMALVLLSCSTIYLLIMSSTSEYVRTKYAHGELYVPSREISQIQILRFVEYRLESQCCSSYGVSSPVLPRDIAIN